MYSVERLNLLNCQTLAKISVLAYLMTCQCLVYFLPSFLYSRMLDFIQVYVLRPRLTKYIDTKFCGKLFWSSVFIRIFQYNKNHMDYLISGFLHLSKSSSQEHLSRSISCYPEKFSKE